MLIGLAGLAMAFPGSAGDTPMNELPLYGGRDKTAEQRRIDRDFVEETVRAAGSRAAAYGQLIDSGWIELRRGASAAAIRRFNQAYLIDPDDARAFAGLGAAVAGQGRFDQAVELLELAAKKDADSARIASDLGRAYMLRATSGGPQSRDASQADLSSALRALDRAVDLDPKLADAYVNRAIVQLLLGRRDAAVENLRHADAIDPSAVNSELRREVLGGR